MSRSGLVRTSAAHSNAKPVRDKAKSSAWSASEWPWGVVAQATGHLPNRSHSAAVEIWARGAGKKTRTPVQARTRNPKGCRVLHRAMSQATSLSATSSAAVGRAPASSRSHHRPNASARRRSRHDCVKQSHLPGDGRERGKERGRGRRMGASPFRVAAARKGIWVHSRLRPHDFSLPKIKMFLKSHDYPQMSSRLHHGTGSNENDDINNIIQYE